MCHCLSRRQFTSLLGAAMLVPSVAIGQDKQAIRALNGSLDIDFFKSQKAARLAANQDQTLIIVGEDAILTDAAFRADIEIDDEGLIGTLQLVSGQALAAFKPRNRRASELLLPNATASIRGTGFYANVDITAPHNYLCCCYGHITFQDSTKGERQELRNSYHNAVMIDEAGDFVKPIYDYPYGHYDDELVLLEAIVNRVPDWTLPDNKMHFLAPYELPQF